MSLLAELIPYLLGAVALVVTWLTARNAGIRSEKDRREKEEAKAVDEAIEVEQDIGALPPELRREALRKWSKSS